MSKQKQETTLTTETPAKTIHEFKPSNGNLLDDPDLKELMDLKQREPEDDEWSDPFNDQEVKDLRERLANRLLQAPMLEHLVPFIERLCGTAQHLDQVMVREWTNWREKVVFAHLRNAFPNCEHVVEIARNAKTAFNDVLIIRKHDQPDRAFRVIYSETINDQTFCFLIEV
jgi:hypothetical protein